MGKIRVLVVDDAVVFRRAVSDALTSDPELEVVGVAANGKIALAKIPQVNPDVVILDIEMPELDGLATLKELRKSYARMPVIMFSALTERGASATLDALALGATDYFTKPTSSSGMEASMQLIREQMIPRIKTFCKARTPTVAPTPQVSVGGSRKEKPRVLAIGCSTGGPNALADLFAGIPADFPLPIVIVQHMPPMFTRLLAQRLSDQFPVRFEEGTSGGLLQPGKAWIAPGDHHMVILPDGPQMRVMLHQDPPENSCRPAVDVLFRSAAKAYGAGTLAVILTGMGQDGLRGCETIRAAGGQVLVQDEATSVVWGMPGFVARAGLADRVVPLSLLAGEVLNRIRY